MPRLRTRRSRTAATRPPSARCCVEYGLNALALVPHMVFLVDFVARGLGQGIAAGSHYWVLYGIGAIVGPLLTGHLADRAGFGPALRVAFLIEAVAVLLPAVSTAPAVADRLERRRRRLHARHRAAGARTHPRAGAARRRAAARDLGQATTSFALFQAAAAYGFS